MRAHAPGSVTGLFAPGPPGDEGRSRGASFAIRDGVTIDLEPAATTMVVVDGEAASFDPLEGILEALDVTALVDVRPEVPLGHGFGASGAATLATALAADAVFDLGRSHRALVEAAHRAELAAGTGRGDVFIQDRGGLLWSGADGSRRTEPDDPIEYATAGGISTSEMLADEAFMDAARQCGSRHLEQLSDPPTLRELAERSRSYAEETGITTAFVEREIEHVEAAGGAAGMALFGETVFAVDVKDVLPHRTTVSTAGARLLSSEND